MSSSKSKKQKETIPQAGSRRFPSLHDLVGGKKRGKDSKQATEAGQETETLTMTEDSQIKNGHNSDAKMWLDSKCKKLQSSQKLRNPNSRFNNGDTLLHGILKYGCNEQQTFYLKKLLEQEADPNMLDYHGHSPLMIACHTGQIEAAQILANHATTLLDLQDRSGNTALTHAVLSENRQIVQTVLSAARLRQRYRMLIIRTSEGRTAENVAQSLCRSDLADLIGKERARVQTLFGSSNKTSRKPQGNWMDSKHRNSSKSQPAPEKSKSHSDLQNVYRTPESSPERRERSKTVPKMAQSVASITNVNRARKRFLSLIGVFHSNGSSA